MTKDEIRALIVDALHYASVYAMSHKKLTPGFLDGSIDVTFEQLDIDSLAAMELCIAIETNTGVSLVPENLGEIGSLNRLTDVLAEELA